MRPKVRRPGPGRRPQPPFPWDNNLRANQRRIGKNYAALRKSVIEAAVDGSRPTASIVRGWHKASLVGIDLAEPAVAGGFRGEGEPGTELSTAYALIGGAVGESPHNVSMRVTQTFNSLEQRLDALDVRLRAGESEADLYPDVIKLCAWLHGEWVRIHPFVDHNGSTARLLTMNIALLYGIALNLPGKPRSDMPKAGLVLDYNTAAQNQMLGDDQFMLVFLNQLANA